MISDLDVIYPSTILKPITILLTTIFAVIVLALTSVYLISLKNRFLPASLSPIATVNYTRSSSNTLGLNLVPLLKVPVTIGDYHTDFEFLIDSGAIVSSVPLLDQTDIDINALKRIVLGSATDGVTYGYLTDMDITLGDSTLTVPVALSDISTPVLGRRGFFDRYTLIFDHQAQSVTIATTKE